MSSNKNGCPTGCEIGPQTPKGRRAKSFKLKEDAAKLYKGLDTPKHDCNGDEERYEKDRFYASYTKGLPQNEFGEVEPDAYCSLLRAMKQGTPDSFAKIPLAKCPKDRFGLVDPQAGLAFDTEGIDSHQLSIGPAFTFRSPDEIDEIDENYWMVLTRDVPFTEYDSNALIDEAARDLSSLKHFHGPKDKSGKVTPQTIFRGFTDGDVKGPYLSQFLIRDIPYGAQLTKAAVEFAVPPKDHLFKDYLFKEDEWLSAQAGCQPGINPSRVPDPRIIQTGRDIANYVHIDELFQAYLNACLLLITPQTRGGFSDPSDPGAILDPGNPYARGSNQVGFGMLGEPNFKTIVAEVATRALKAVWFEKWSVHRRLRPEAFGGRIHFHLNKKRTYEFDASELATIEKGVLDRVKSLFGSFFLPMAFPEGCPLHPAYGAGHATVAGACVTLLKAIFNEGKKLEDDLGIRIMVPSADGKSLVPYTGKGAGDITIGDELNKLAGNVGIARNIAGVHWRSDYSESLKLGEQVALFFLQEYAQTYNEDVTFSLTRFDGKRKVKITKGGAFQDFRKP